MQKFSYIATLEEIPENEFNLNIRGYGDTFEEEPEADIGKVQGEIEALEKDLFGAQRSAITKHLKNI